MDELTYKPQMKWLLKASNVLRRIYLNNCDLDALAMHKYIEKELEALRKKRNKCNNCSKEDTKRFVCHICSNEICSACSEREDETICAICYMNQTKKE